MAIEVTVQDQMDVIQYKRTLPDEDIRRHIILFQLTDDWTTDIKAGELRENYAQILRSQLSRLSQFYAEAGRADHAQLAAILHDATFFAENEGLTPEQLGMIQFILTYFQRVALTQDELRECTMKLYRSGIEVIPPMPDFEEFLAMS
ncbi:MAG: hypothetical protein R3E79_53720 [Caldilineaceae bacterium]